MNLVMAILGTAGLGALVVMLMIMGRLTQRWELVTRIQSHYRLFYLAAALVGVAALMRLIRIGYFISETEPLALSDSTSLLYVFLYHLPLVVGLTISILVTWRNWAWILREST